MEKNREDVQITGELENEKKKGGGPRLREGIGFGRPKEKFQTGLVGDGGANTKGRTRNRNCPFGLRRSNGSKRRMCGRGSNRVWVK